MLLVLLLCFLGCCCGSGNGSGGNGGGRNGSGGSGVQHTKCLFGSTSSKNGTRVVAGRHAVVLSEMPGQMKGECCF